MTKNQNVEAIETKPKSIYDCYFSNGKRYIHPNDRPFITPEAVQSYYEGFTEHDQHLDDAITCGAEFQLSCNLWRIYDDAVDNFGLSPIDPCEWLFKHAPLNEKTIIINSQRERIIMSNWLMDYKYYDFIHGEGAAFIRHAKVL